MNELGNLLSVVKQPQSWRGMLRAAVVGFALIGVLAASDLASAQQRPMPDGFAELAARVSPAVVTIQAVQGPGGPAQPGQQAPRPGGASLGTGFIIDASGVIVTNAHVVGRPTSVKVILQDRREYVARVMGVDELTDLAVLKIEAQNLPTVRFANSDNARVGEWVMAIGSPFGLIGTVTAGIISALNREIGQGLYDTFIQIDASINSGNSGGPSFNMQGEVIGVNSRIFTPNQGNIGLGFAIPANLAQRIVADLRERGRVERGWLGIQMADTRSEKRPEGGVAPEAGVRIDSVDRGSPAERAGIRGGDVIVSFNGRPVTTQRQLAVAVAELRAGTSAQVVLRRESQEQTVTVTIQQRPDQTAQAPQPGGDGKPGGQGGQPPSQGRPPPAPGGQGGKILPHQGE
jgi:serine protease Do